MHKIICSYGPQGSDCTGPIYVHFDDGLTVREFIDYQLKNNEWGYIGIKSTVDQFFGSPKFEYKKNQILGEMFSDDILDSEVKEIKGSGGWSRSDFIIELKEKCKKASENTIETGDPMLEKHWEESKDKIIRIETFQLSPEESFETIIKRAYCEGYYSGRLDQLLEDKD